MERLLFGGAHVCSPFVFQLLPLFVMKLFGSSRGFPGLFLATLYAGSLRLESASVLYILSNYQVK